MCWIVWGNVVGPQDLNVKETLPQLVTLAEAHILIYEAQK